MEFPEFDLLDIGGSLFKMIQYFCYSFCSSCCDIINELLGAIDNMGIFTLSLGSPELNPVWTAVSSVSTNVSMVIAYALLGFFVALEFYEATKNVSQSRFGGLEQIMRCLIKILIVKVVIDNTPALMRGLYDLTINITRGVERYATGLSGDSSMMPTQELLGAIEAATPDQVGMLILMFLIMIVAVAVVFFATVFVQVIALSRLIEILVCIAFAALPLVCLVSQETKTIGIGFLKNYIAVCLQGTILMLLIKLMVPLFSAVAVLLSNMMGDTTSTALQMVVSCVAPLSLCIAMITTIQHSREFANRIVGAA